MMEANTRIDKSTKEATGGVRKGVFRNFGKFTGLRPATLLKESLAQVFSYEFCEIFKNTFFIEHLRWLLLKML